MAFARLIRYVFGYFIPRFFNGAWREPFFSISNPANAFSRKAIPAVYEGSMIIKEVELGERIFRATPCTVRCTTDSSCSSKIE